MRHSVSRSVRIAIAVAFVASLASACSHDSSAPLSPVDDALLAAAAVDPALTSAPAQATLPGLVADEANTFSATVSTADACTYTASIGRIVCTPVVRDGLTYSRSVAYYDAKGVAQPKRDLNTRSMNTQVTVKGTTTTKRGPLVVDRSSNLTVSGLGKGAATHTMDGTEQGTSVGTFTVDKVTVTSKEAFTSVSAAVVVPAEGKTKWPLSGTTTRTWTQTVTREGGATRTSTSSESVTFNGTSTVPVSLTRDGKTKSCTKDLATGKLTCS